MTSTLFDLPTELLRGNTRENRDHVRDWVGSDKKRMARLMDLYLHGEWRLAQLAAGVVCLVAEKHPSMIDPWLPKLLKRIQQRDVHDAVRRCGMWTLQVVEIPPRLAGRIAQFSFDMLEDVSQPIAMRVYAMTILVRLCKNEPDLAREVRTTIETVLPYGTGAFQARAQKELRRLRSPHVVSLPKDPSMTSRRGVADHLLTLFFAFAMLSPGVDAQGRTETGFLDRTVEVGGRSYHYQVYVPFSYTPTQQWPVILFLHGAGERGSDGLLPTHAGLGAAIRQHPERYPAIVVFPQSPLDSLWAGVPSLVAIAALDRTMEEFQSDPDRVYLTGLSMGGNGSWYLAYRYPARFAALAPVCGWVRPMNAWVARAESVVPGDTVSAFQSLAQRLGRMPVWIFHGEADLAVPIDQSRLAAAALKSVNPDVQFTELPGIGHNSWDAAYGSERFSQWLFAQKRKP